MSDGLKLPLTVAGYAHPVTKGAAGVKDADGRWVAKCHPLNGDADDVKASEDLARLFAAAPALLEACDQAAYWLEEAQTDPSVRPDEILRVLRAASAMAGGDEECCRFCGVFRMPHDTDCPEAP